MPFDNDSSYTDGIQVKISEKYKRRPVIRLPVSVQNCALGPALYEEYDFRLERTVLSTMEEWKQAREEQAKRREERLKRLKSIDEEAEKMKQLSLEESAENNIDANNTSGLQSSILKPTNATFAQPIPRPIPPSFNFSDFEADNSSPFDNMELKTINDMEVLASVLSSEPSASSSGKPTSPPSINNNVISNKNGMVWNRWDEYNVAYSSPQYHEPPTQYSNIYATSAYNPPECSYSQSNWMSVREIAPSHLASSPMTGAHTTVATPYRYSSVDEAMVQPLQDYRLQSQKSNSKSVPDLVLELEEELKEKQRWEEQRRKTKTPPPRTRPTLSTGTGPSLSTSSGLENWKPWPDLESPRHSGPDAMETLSPSHQSLAKSVSEMGFPLERTVRTVRRFNGDDKKVVEFLIQVHRLEEKKFNGDLVEKALHANNYDEKETQKHLEAAVVLLDLGFDHDKVQSVLLECKNDRDIALDRLIS